MCISVDNSNGKARFHVLAILCGVALLNAAGAEERFGEPVTKVVNYADLNLNTPAGAQALYRRLRAAAAIVCKRYESHTLQGMSRQRACFDQAIASAVKEIDSSAVTAYHLARTGKAERPVKVAAEK
jgi:UrcA family protein